MNGFPSRPLGRALALLLVLVAFLTRHVEAARLIESTSLNACMEDSSFTASLFNISFWPDTGSLIININGVSEISGNVTAELSIIAYGYTAITKDLDPCKMKGFEGFCPMSQGPIELSSTVSFESNIVKQIPGIAYQVPDLDGKAKIVVNSTDTGRMVACVEAPLSNGKTVHQDAVSWITAIIAGMGLAASAITSGLGHSNTAAHVAANALSLFGYMQAQAIIGMTAVTLPPIVQAWTQNFAWSMGIIKIEFMQDIFTWYIKATGGKPATLLSQVGEVSVQIAKRSVDTAGKIPYAMSRAEMYGFLEEPQYFRKRDYYSQVSPRSELVKRATPASESEVIKVSGIDRVAYKAHIESTNLFMTGIAFFVAFLGLTTIGVCAFKWFFELAVKAKWMKGSKFLDFRNGWLTVLKGIMYRIVLIGFPQMTILCLWELTVKDSPAAVVLAVFFFFSMAGILGWASFKVIHIAQRSLSLHKNPAYILYSDPAALNRWGFLYVQFRASAYYFIVPVLLYALTKGMFVAFGQKSGTVEAVAFVIIEIVFLVAISMMRPWMDKRTNIFNISIGVMNLLNVVMLLVFTGIFHSADIVGGVMGVIFFIMNAVFALVLLILVLISSVYALISKNPDVRYQPMRDDRGSFIKSNSQMIASTELDALGVTARGEMKSGYMTRDLDDDGVSFTNSSATKNHYDASQVPLPPSTANSHAPSYQSDMPRSPVDPAVPMFPASSHNHDPPRSPYGPPTSVHSGNNTSLLTPGGSPSPSPPHSQHSYEYGQQLQGGGYPAARNNQPMNWHVGAGYEH